MARTYTQSLINDVLHQYDGDLVQAVEALETRMAATQPDWPMSLNAYHEAIANLNGRK